jgi:hypothetical protein
MFPAKSPYTIVHLSIEAASFLALADLSEQPTHSEWHPTIHWTVLPMPRDIRIASPCTADWNRMPGDDRIRYCPECQLNVYNFSAMTRAEVETLVVARQGRLCARFYQRPDGTMLTQNCPVGVREALRRVARAAASVLSAFLTVTPALIAAEPQQKQDAPLVQIKSVQAPAILEVVDPSGAVIPNAKVSLTSESSGIVLSATTDNEGKLRLTGVPPSEYSVSISSPGFAQFEAEHVSIRAKKALKFQLTVAATVMGGIVETAMLDLQRSPISDHSSEPTTSVVVGEIVSIDTRNPIRKFFSLLRRIF